MEGEENGRADAVGVLEFMEVKLIPAKTSRS
jgi:hypothetical protein